MADTKGVDLMVALGVPKKGDAKGKDSSNSYWADKPAELKGYLMDAVDSKLTQEERAEALCHAMETHLEHTAGEYDQEESAEGDTGAESDSDYGD